MFPRPVRSCSSQPRPSALPTPERTALSKITGGQTSIPKKTCPYKPHRQSLPQLRKWMVGSFPTILLFVWYILFSSGYASVNIQRSIYYGSRK